MHNCTTGRKRDGAPTPEVIAQHAGTAKVLNTLRPFAVAMAGAGELDPFKD